MSVIQTAKDFVSTDLPVLREAFKHEKACASPAMAALCAQHAANVNNAFTWTIQHEDHQDQSSFRAMSMAAYALRTSSEMINAFANASQEEIPASLQDMEDAILERFDELEEQNEQKQRPVLGKPGPVVEAPALVW